MARQRHIRLYRYNLRIHAYLSTLAKLPQTRIPTILCTHHSHDPCLRRRLLVTSLLVISPLPNLLAGCRLGYRFYRSAPYYEFGRDAYESIVICSFMVLMCNFLGSEIHDTLRRKNRGRLIFPLCFIKVNPSGLVFLPGPYHD